MKEMFGIFDEVLKELINRRNELKELRLAMPIFEGKDIGGCM